MKKAILLSGVAFFTLALSEPQPINEGETRVRSVKYHDAMVIKAVLARGQTFSMEVPRGFVVYSVSPSEQDIMSEAPAPVQQAPGGQGIPDAMKPSDCANFSNIRICMKLDRFVYFTPITDLEAQPVHMIVMKERVNAPALEYPIIMEIKTGERNYYGVRLEMPTPPAPVRPVRRTVRRPLPHGGGVALPGPVAAPENRGYTIQGDKSLIGEPGR